MKYVKPEVEVLEFDLEDVIRTSLSGEGSNPGNPDELPGIEGGDY